MRIQWFARLCACVVFTIAPGCDQNPTAPRAPNRDAAEKASPAPEINKGKAGGQRSKPLD